MIIYFLQKSYVCPTPSCENQFFLFSLYYLKGVFTFFHVGHMLNPPVSKVPPWKDFFLGHPFGLQVPKRGAQNPSEGFCAIFSLFFPSHRRTLWDRNFSLKYVKSPYLKFLPLKGFSFRTTRSAYRSQNVVHKTPPRGFVQFFCSFSPPTAVPFEIEIFP